MKVPGILEKWTNSHSHFEALGVKGLVWYAACVHCYMASMPLHCVCHRMCSCSLLWGISEPGSLSLQNTLSFLIGDANFLNIY